MNKNVGNILKVVLFFGFGALVVWLSIRNITPEQWVNMGEAAKEAKYGWLALSVVFGVLSHLSRSMRWQLMLETLGHRPRLGNTFMAVMSGLIVNLAIPRFGEVVRVGLISRYEKIPIDKAVGTLVTDRAIDVLTLLSLTLIATLLQFDIVGDYVLNQLWPPISAKLSGLFSGNMILLGVVGIVLAIGFFVLLKYLGKIGAKLKEIIGSVWEGVLSIKKLKHPGQFVLHSILIWGLYLAMTYICFFAFDYTADLGFLTGLAVLCFATFGFLATPGGVGTYPLVVATILLLYGISYELGTLFGWIIWAVQTFLVIVFGAISFLYLPIFNKNYEPPQSSTAEN